MMSTDQAEVTGLRKIHSNGKHEIRTNIIHDKEETK